MKKLLALLSLIFFFTTCKKVPVADFNSSKTEYLSGETIELTNTSVDAESIRWTLPDGSTSRENSISYPTQELAVAQKFSFKLEAISKSGTKSDYVVKNITTKVPTGQLVIAQGFNYNDVEAELTIAGENKGKFKIKYATSINVLNCGDQSYLNFTLPIGSAIIALKFSGGFISTHNLYIAKTDCNRIFIK